METNTWFSGFPCFGKGKARNNDTSVHIASFETHETTINKGYNVTCHSYFMSFDLCLRLAK